MERNDMVNHSDFSVGFPFEELTEHQTYCSWERMHRSYFREDQILTIGILDEGRFYLRYEDAKDLPGSMLRLREHFKAINFEEDSETLSGMEDAIKSFLLFVEEDLELYELELLRDTPLSELPLLMSEIETPKARDYLAQRLQGEVSREFLKADGDKIIGEEPVQDMHPDTVKQTVIKFPDL